MFEPTPEARIFALPLGVDFSRGFVDGVLERLAGQPPEALAKVRIYVNTRRSARGLSDIFAESGACLLPDIRVISDLARDPAVPFAQPTPPLRRQLIIARLVAAYLDAQPDVAPKSAIYDLADSLGDLFDGFQGEGVALAALHDIDVGGQSDHWERSLKFLEILAEYWDQHRPENAPDGEERQRLVAQYYADLWAENPPQHPVIVAGSTGSRGATALFMEAVANLPQGAIVLPGYDYDMPEVAWKTTTPDHPQFGFRNLADRLGFQINPPLWHQTNPAASARNKLVSLALRPAPVTDQWLNEGPQLTPTLNDACKNLTLIEAPSPRAEAESIAIRLRQAAGNGQKAALVTPDRVLARRVSAVLGRWGMTPDDSADRPLPLTPPGVFLRRIIALVGMPLTPANLLAILKHPLCGGADEARINHLQMTRKLEMKVLRGGAPFVDWAALNVWANKVGEGYGDWIKALETAFHPLLSTPAEMPLADWVKLHRTVAETLSGAPLWQKDAGEAARATLEAIEKEAAFGGTIEAVQYRALFQSVLNDGQVRKEAYLPHPNIAILGTLEARVQSADLVILGGMNEGIWPSTPTPDPWLSRDMRRQIGLPLPERQTGLSAHDFQQAVAARDVVISRAIRDGEAPTVASRWVIRLLNLLEGLDEIPVKEMRARGDDLLALAVAMNRPEAKVEPAPRPSPSPPIKARPEKLSVTRIETLIRDPYAIYADKVLKLRALDPPGKDPDARERGNAMHNVMEAFLKRTRDGLPDNAREVFLEAAHEVLEAEVPWPSTRRFWMARLEKIADWFLEGEVARRERANPMAWEVMGARDISGLERKFTLTAKADRIDLAADGSVAIYDYKSGAVPSKKQLETFAVQLPLEGAIARAGGFTDIAKAKVSHLELIGLGSGGTEKTLEAGEEVIVKVWQDLTRLIAAFGAPELGYTARSRPEHLTYESDFDHLSRFGEWQDGDGFETEDME